MFSFVRLVLFALLASAPPAYAKDGSILASFDAFLLPSGREALGGPATTLDPEGTEIRDRLVRPRLALLPPVDPALVDTKTAEVFVTRGEAVARIMRGEVKLLGGIPWQDLGDPVDWLHAPDGDLQWTTHLHRHYFLIGPAFAYRHTSDNAYAEKVVGTLLDWVERFPLGVDRLRWPSPENSWSRRWSDPDIPPTTREGLFPGYVDGPWTSLSTEARVHFWLELLQLLEDAPALTNEVMATLLVSLARDHRPIMLDYPRQMNQYQAVAIGLIHYGLYFPYLRGANDALAEGWKRLGRHTEREIYPDGSMAECSPNYGIGMLRKLADMIHKAALVGAPPPDHLGERLAHALRYMALVADPTLHSPRIAKGGQDLTSIFRQLATRLSVPAISFRLGADSPVRDVPLDHCFAWAGHVVFRSSWEDDATWLFFEPGPRGSGHADAAQLGVQLQSRGAWLLTDPGFYSYSGAGEAGAMSRYLRSTAAHNLVLVDGHNQRMTAPGKSKSFNTEPGDYHWKATPTKTQASGTYTFGFGDGDRPLPVRHTRTVTYQRNTDQIVIEDTLADTSEAASVSPCALQWRWQLHPDAIATIDGQRLEVTNGAARMVLSMQTTAPVVEVPPMTLVQGSRNPRGGWYSQEYGVLEPAPMAILELTTHLPITVRTTIVLSAATQKR